MCAGANRGNRRALSTVHGGHDGRESDKKGGRDGRVSEHTGVGGTANPVWVSRENEEHGLGTLWILHGRGWTSR